MICSNACLLCRRGGSLLCRRGGRRGLSVALEFARFRRVTFRDVLPHRPSEDGRYFLLALDDTALDALTSVVSNYSTEKDRRWLQARGREGMRPTALDKSAWLPSPLLSFLLLSSSLLVGASGKKERNIGLRADRWDKSRHYRNGNCDLIMVS